MNNNDTNNLGNNGLNPTNNMGMNQVPTSMNPPMNGGDASFAPSQNSDMQGMSLGSVQEQNVAPAMVTPEAQPQPVQPPVEERVDLLNPTPNPSIPNGMNSNPTVSNGMDMGMQSTNLNQAPVSNTPSNMGAPVMDNGMNTPFPTTPDMNSAAPTMGMPDANMTQPNPMGNMNAFGGSVNPSTDSMNPFNSMNNGMNFDMNQNNMMGMQQPASSVENPFAQPNMGMNPNMNGNVFGSVPTPPVGNLDGGKKKGGKLKFSKTSIILIAVLVIAIIGFAVWYLLNNAGTSQVKSDISTKDLVLELGQPLSTDVSDYAILTGFNASTCSVDTSKVNTKRMGSYEYTVTCGSTSKVGSIVLQDKTAPKVSVRDVMVTPGSMITIDDFIIACDDYTDCTYELEDASQALENLTQTEGTYSINLIVSDDYDNKTTVQLNLVVTANAPVRTMFCTPSSTNDDALKATLETSYTYGISAEDALVKTEKNYLYTFENEEDYLAVKNEYDETKGINGVVGQTVFSDSDFTISITVNMSNNELGTEFNMNPFPTDYEGLRQFNLDQGITCKNR